MPQRRFPCRAGPTTSRTPLERSAVDGRAARPAMRRAGRDRRSGKDRPAPGDPGRAGYSRQNRKASVSACTGPPSKIGSLQARSAFVVPEGLGDGQRRRPVHDEADRFPTPREEHEHDRFCEMGISKVGLRYQKYRAIVFQPLARLRGRERHDAHEDEQRDEDLKRHGLASSVRLPPRGVANKPRAGSGLRSPNSAAMECHVAVPQREICSRQPCLRCGGATRESVAPPARFLRAALRKHARRTPPHSRRRARAEGSPA